MQKLVFVNRYWLPVSGPIQTWNSSFLKKALSKSLILENKIGTKFQKCSNLETLWCKILVWIFLRRFGPWTFNFCWFWAKVRLFSILLRSAVKISAVQPLKFFQLEAHIKSIGKKLITAKLAYFPKVDLGRL